MNIDFSNMKTYLHFDRMLRGAYLMNSQRLLNINYLHFILCDHVSDSESFSFLTFL